MPEQYVAELVVDAKSEVGEGPVWDARSGVLWWTDIPGRGFHRWDPASGVHTSATLDREVGTAVPRRSGGLLLAVRGGFAAYDGVGSGPLELLLSVEDDKPELRMNDGKCDAAGRLYVSTMAFSADQPVGSLWRLDPDWTVHRLVDGLTIGNGMAWSADGLTMYFIDSACHRVDAFTVDPATGDLSDRRPLFDVPAADGLPDGMCIDQDGALWVALFGGGAVRRYSTDGELLAEVPLPVANVTCPVFGGPDWDELYITTGWGYLDDEERAAQPEAGGLFRVRPGVRGTAPHAFAG
jgi:sugar lactone lactonase YvrE